MNKPIITICILHYKKLPQLKKTVELIQKHTELPFLIKILNQKFLNREIKSYLSTLSKNNNVEIDYCDKNLGCPGGRNRLLKNINTPFVATLDDDIYVQKNWLKPVIKFLKRNKTAGAVSYPLFQPDGKIDSIGGKYLIIDKKRKTIKIKTPPLKILRGDRQFVKIDDTLGGAMVFKIELLNYFQWDPKYFIGFGDIDKGMQLKSNNNRFKLYLYTKSRLIHDKVSKDRKRVEYNKQRRDYHKIRDSYLYFVDKWGYRFTQPRDFFYRYFCLLPNSFIQNIVYFWLKNLKND